MAVVWRPSDDTLLFTPDRPSDDGLGTSAAMNGACFTAATSCPWETTATMSAAAPELG